MSDQITFATYPDMFLDRGEQVENPNYDNEMREFTVPAEWAKAWILSECGMTAKEFDEWYTWDVTDRMYSDSIREKVLVSTEIIDCRMPLTRCK